MTESCLLFQCFRFTFNHDQEEVVETANRYGMAADYSLAYSL